MALPENLSRSPACGKFFLVGRVAHPPPAGSSMGARMQNAARSPYAAHHSLPDSASTHILTRNG